MKILTPALAGLLLLGGCVSAGSSGAINPLPSALAGGARVASVELRNTPDGASSGFDSRFEAAVQTQLNKCATGAEALTLEVSLDGYYAPNPAMAAFAPMKSLVSGVARLRDAGGTIVGEYRIERSLMIGGIAGAIAAANAESNMSNAFGEELCKQAFRT
jgi:hypothetical protein